MSVCEPWLTIADVCTPGDESASPQVVRAAIASAQAWLFDATCAQFTGVCTSVLRPTLPRGEWVDDCDDRSLRWRIDLSPWVTGPVLSIESIAVEGVEVANTDDVDYRLADGRWLIAHEGGALRPWPRQRLDRPVGAEGTWSVTVTHGRAVPPHVLDAAADLARQLVAKCTGGECLLPDNATSVSRDGVTVELNVPADGQTGLPLVDTVAAMYRCRRTRRLWDPAEGYTEVARL